MCTKPKASKSLAISIAETQDPLLQFGVDLLNNKMYDKKYRISIFVDYHNAAVFAGYLDIEGYQALNKFNAVY